jgi:hypothetical protein
VSASLHAYRWWMRSKFGFHFRLILANLHLEAKLKSTVLAKPFNVFSSVDFDVLLAFNTLFSEYRAT